jgi:hypothetical protein
LDGGWSKLAKQIDVVTESASENQHYSVEQSPHMPEVLHEELDCLVAFQEKRLVKLQRVPEGECLSAAEEDVQFD